MPPNLQRHDTDLPQPCDRIVEMFGDPIEQWRPSRDALPATPQPASRLQAVLSWLWQFFLEGCAAYAYGMYPYFPETSDPSVFFGPQRRAPGEPVAEARPEPSPWQFRAPVRRHPPSPDNGGMQRLPSTGARLRSLSPVDGSRADP